MEIDDDTKFISKLKEKIPNLIDPQYEKDVNLMKDVNIMGYFLEILELMKTSQLPIEQLLLHYSQQKFHIQSGVTSKMKSFVTILLYSYMKKSNNSQDLSYIKRYFQLKKSNSSISFYIKLRKTIITNFSYNSRTQMLDGLNLKFDDWSTLTTRFLGAESISQIGARVKEVNSKTKVYDKILTNSIDAVFFVQTCVDLFESKDKSNLHQEKEKEKRSQSQNSQNENSQNVSQNQIQDEEGSQNEEGNSLIESPEEIQQSIQIALNPTSNIQQKQENVESKDKSNVIQQKLINSLQETKYQLLENQMKSEEAIKKVLKVVDIVLLDYESLVKHSKKQQLFIQQLVDKCKNSHNLTEQEKKQFQELNSHQLLQNDFKAQLQQTGIHKFIK
ncbi:unnamed protein product (macronuclear) [Paramecium tetraurelia]|uniref:Uncharacterized protein n=1 Tax=Paramecium tetraurelia TaxID=5888 RepID=A0EG78_PARTE|nr:uncharacterized protein GSPATT00026643001 [Paramecium tetraurelia]CAK94319.1 unnamed protein product [Paramecium tetraurelia]|eukprot:XP_001461692.1 hypothetical protein (macronuclear) [Paramecium tetraurelia strain d4-2]